MSLSSLASDLLSPGKLIAHLRSPLYRNGYALVLSTVATSGMGVLYWILAARSYTTEVVGYNSVMISTMSFIAQVSQLGLGDALNRFIPRAGESTRRFILTAYAISLSLTLLVSVTFLLGVDLWAPALDFLHDTPLVSLAFILATLCWCIFALQDAVLVGLRQAIWVPIENGAYGVMKIILIIALAAALSQFGVFASWALPLILLIIPVNILIFYYLVPRHIRATTQDSEPLAFKPLARYVSGDYFSSLIWITTISLMPILIVDRAGAAANAYFYLPWTIAYSLYLVSRNMGMSFIAEAVSDRDKMEQYSYRTLAQTWKLLFVAMVVILIGAPYILRLFGARYSTEGTTLLRLLALSAFPNLVITQFVSMARVQRRVGTILITLAVLCALILSSSVILLERLGITGVGIAWLASQTLVALVLIFTEFRTVLLTHANFQLLMSLSAGPRRLWWRLQNWRWLYRNREIVPAVLQSLSDQQAHPGEQPLGWEIHHLIPSSSAMRLVTLGPPGAAPKAILYLPGSREAVQNCRKQAEVLASLHHETRLGDWSGLLPTVLSEGVFKDQSYLLLDLLPGIEARKLISHPAVRQPMLVAAARTIQELHKRTSRKIIVDDDYLQRWVDEPVRAFQRLGERWQGEADHQIRLDLLAQNLHQALSGMTLPVSWIHGDYWPANFLVGDDGLKLTGIVDWDLARQDDLPFLDLLNLLLSTQVLFEHRELGDILLERLDRPEWTPEEQEIMAAAPSSIPDNALSMRQLLLIYWLRHSAANLNKSAHFAHHALWVARNVDAVIRKI